MPHFFYPIFSLGSPWTCVEPAAWAVWWGYLPGTNSQFELKTFFPHSLFSLLYCFGFVQNSTSYGFVHRVCSNFPWTWWNTVYEVYKASGCSIISRVRGNISELTVPPTGDLLSQIPEATTMRKVLGGLSIHDKCTLWCLQGWCVLHG